VETNASNGGNEDLGGIAIEAGSAASVRTIARAGWRHFQAISFCLFAQVLTLRDRLT
jgi:hypothetical protein